MTQTTDTTTAETANMVATAPLEQAIATALESMRRAATKAAVKGRDDFYDAWPADVMDRQPIIFVAAALPGEMMAWPIDPSDAEGVLEAHVAYRFDVPDAEGTLRSDVPHVAKHEMWPRLFASVAEDVSWLVKERSSQHLSEYGRWRSETD